MRGATINENDVYAAHASALALGAAMVAFFHDEASRPQHLERARMELTRAANALGCTVKADTGTMVIMQQTETKITEALHAHMASVRCRAQEADELRRQLEAEREVSIDLGARLRIHEEGERLARAETSRLLAYIDQRERSVTGWSELEDKALWAKPAAAVAA